MTAHEVISTRKGRWALPVSCSQAGGHCGVAVVEAAIVPNPRSNLTFPFERCPAQPMELMRNGGIDTNSIRKRSKQMCKDQINSMLLLWPLVTFGVSTSSGSIKNSLWILFFPFRTSATPPPSQPQSKGKIYMNSPSSNVCTTFELLGCPSTLR